MRSASVAWLRRYWRFSFCELELKTRDIMPPFYIFCEGMIVFRQLIEDEEVCGASSKAGQNR
jgi:hypothetical protein